MSDPGQTEEVCLVDNDAPVQRSMQYLLTSDSARPTAMQISPIAYFMKPFNDERFLDAARDALGQASRL